MSSKTPLMVLQELCTMNRITPTFNMLGEDVGPKFTFEVILTFPQGTLRCVADGRSKKDAKQLVAQLMLDKIKSNNIQLKGVENIHSSPKHDALDLKHDVNPESVVRLITFCEENRLPTPSYLLTGDVGPPHAKQFTMLCAVASINQSATHVTKKGAKQLAAGQMLSLLSNMSPCLLPQAHASSNLNEVPEEIKKGAREILAARKPPKHITQNVSKYYCMFNELEEEIRDSALQILSQDLEAEEKLKLIMDILGCEFTFDNSWPTESKKTIYNIRIHCIPAIVVAAYDKTEVYQKAIDTFEILLPKFEEAS